MVSHTDITEWYGMW